MTEHYRPVGTFGLDDVDEDVTEYLADELVVVEQEEVGVFRVFTLVDDPHDPAEGGESSVFDIEEDWWEEDVDAPDVPEKVVRAFSSSETKNFQKPFVDIVDHSGDADLNGKYAAWYSPDSTKPVSAVSSETYRESDCELLWIADTVDEVIDGASSVLDTEGVEDG